MKLKIYFFMLFFTSFFTHPLSYDFAIRAAQKGNIAQADQQIRTIVVNCPDSPDVLYDAGVVADQLHNHNQAIAYFTRAAECATDKNIQFRSYFNAGNSSVAHKDLKLALEYYDKALAIEHDNEYVRHNREKVAQMLQDQEKPQDQEKKDTQNSPEKEDQENQDKKENNDNQEDNSEQKNQNDQNQNDQPKNNGNEDDQKKENNSSKNESNEKSQGEQASNPNQERKGEERKQQGKKQESDQGTPNDQKRNSEQKFDEKSKNAQNKKEQQKRELHEKSPEKQHINKNNSSIPSSDEQEQGKTTTEKPSQDQGSGTTQMKGNQIDEENQKQKSDQQIDDPWLMHVLNEQELNDKAVNKKLMEARIRQYGGKNDQNCW